MSSPRRLSYFETAAPAVWTSHARRGQSAVAGLWSSLSLGVRCRWHGNCPLRGAYRIDAGGNGMPLLSREDIRTLIERRPGWHVSMFIPMHRAGLETLQNP